ncbi:HlyD family secretion protein [Chamaesiphon sp.]|uniref:HlyD family secretion protein n=1 Tax=Chamaesiphon sp. TaxID=2814140 RepID=UPI003593BC1C
MNNAEFDDANPGKMAAKFERNGHHVTTTIAKDAVELMTIDRVLTPTKISSPITVLQVPDYALTPTTPADFLPSIGQWISVGGIVMVASFGIAIALSTILKYKVTVQAPATIRPVGELRLVQSTIEGSVMSISVRENQTVNKGDPIATVRDLRLESKLQTKRSQLIGEIEKAKSQILAVDAQIGASDRQGIAEIDRDNRTISGIAAELSRAQRDRRDKRTIAQAEVAEAQANCRTAKIEQQVAEAELTVADANLKSIQAASKAAIARFQRYQSVAAAGAISTNQLEEAQLAAEQQTQAIAAQVATIFKQHQSVAKVAETVVAAAARIERTQAALDPSPAEVAAIVQKIARERATGKVAIAQLQQQRQKLLQQRTEILNQIATSDREVAQIATELQPTAILAPVSGTVQELNLRNTAQVVHPGDRLAQIVPTGIPLQIEAYVAIADVSNVKVGQKVQMRISACPYTDYGVGSGIVRAISADAKPMQRNVSNSPQQLQATPNDIYKVTIAPDNLKLSRGSSKCQIRSGMDGRADIISTEETVLQFILRKARLWV